MYRDRIRAGGKRRYKQGRQVPADGLYSDDWGGELILMRGELFPAHPYMGETHWTLIMPASAMPPDKPSYHDHTSW